MLVKSVTFGENCDVCTDCNMKCYLWVQVGYLRFQGGYLWVQGGYLWVHGGYLGGSGRLSGWVSKGAGVFERPGQTMDNLSVFGTSRTSNGLKIEP